MGDLVLSRLLILRPRVAWFWTGVSRAANKPLEGLVRFADLSTPTTFIDKQSSLLGAAKSLWTVRTQKNSYYDEYSR